VCAILEILEYMDIFSRFFILGRKIPSNKLLVRSFHYGLQYLNY